MFRIGNVNSVINIENTTMETLQCIPFALLRYIALSTVYGDYMLLAAVKYI
jgi:hypothetical protein